MAQPLRLQPHTGDLTAPSLPERLEDDKRKRALDFLTDPKVLHDVTLLTWEERVTEPVGSVSGPELSPSLSELQTST